MEGWDQAVQDPVPPTAGLELGADDGGRHAPRLAVEVEFQPDGRQAVERSGGVGPTAEEAPEMGGGGPLGQGRRLGRSQERHRQIDDAGAGSQAKLENAGAVTWQMGRQAVQTRDGWRLKERLSEMRAEDGQPVAAIAPEGHRLKGPTGVGASLRPYRCPSRLRLHPRAHHPTAPGRCRRGP
jgi:hypothetical protein